MSIPKTIFVISGPSGSGKTTLLKGILSDRLLRRKLARSVSYTTRPKRSGEKNGRDYYFITAQEFQEKLRSKKLLEWTEYLGYYYGTPTTFFSDKYSAKSGLLLCLDIKGARRVRELYPKNSVSIFVMPLSLKLLPERIQKRCSRTGAKEIEQRLALAEEEVRASRHYEYRIVNKDLGKAIAALRTIIKKELSAQAVRNKRGVRT
ncbi:MAG: guanylate kinase [Candidatus Omnitrophica bacterium]|nr:guanylate kinase [Candidatus Omnitrophota bacterium]MDD5565730.1 guanylate kinase [Candidatus Omnitrophota bacterium]